MHLRPSRSLSSLLFAAAACGSLAGAPARAAELGEVRMASYIGQPLAADIELSLVEDAAQSVQARVADAEVYRGAGIAVPPVLATLHVSVMRRDGRQVVHVTSLRPVDGDHLHLYLELVDHGQRSVRLATLWLTPDPNPAPAAPAAPVVATPAVAAPVPAPPASSKGPVVPVTFEDEPVAPVRARPPAPQAVAPRPPPALHAAPPPRLPAALPGPHPGPAAVQACAHPAPEAQACIALGVKNAELRTQLGSLEQKVRGIQASLGAAPASQPDHHIVDEAAKAPPGPKSIHAIKPLAVRKPPAPA
jgi:hypothetical protein